jgi:A/G-specific adenine glycosylase
MRAWAGLGYYARARNLHACAQAIVSEHAGKFPQTEAALLTLPGIGPYTAGAITAIAFNVPAAAVDGNVERVISRLYAIEVPLPASKPAIRQRTKALVPDERAGDFAQALMDLGATICTPKSPNCLICPLSAECVARQSGLAEILPLKAPRKIVPVRKAYVYWLQRRDGAVLLRTRPDKGLLGGMMEIPSTPWASDLPDEISAGQPIKADWCKIPGTVKHTFTHFHLEMTVLAGKNFQVETPADSRWTQADSLPDEALPTVMKKVIQHMMAKPPVKRAMVKRE